MPEIDRRRIAALTESENEKFRNRTGAISRDPQAGRLR